MEYLYEKFPVYLGVAMGFLLISLSTVNIYNLFINEAYTLLNMTSWIFMLACGIFIIVIGWRNLVMFGPDVNEQGNLYLDIEEKIIGQ